MNLFLWILQISLALHTAMGAVWKFSNSEQAVPSLSTIPHGLWMAMSGLELFFTLGLIAPLLNRRLSLFAPLAAVCIAAEMLFFCVVHVSSGATDNGQIVYWLIVAAICSFIIYGRLKLKRL